MAPLRLALCGATGRMGRAVAELVRADPRWRLVATASGRDRVEPGFLRGAEAAVDFSAPGPSLRLAEAAARARVPAVIGTTGFSPGEHRRLAALARRVALVVAPNMSPGMTVLAQLARRAAAALPGYEAVVCETHHARKRDAPSGSALRLAESVASAGGRRPPAVVSLRAGDIVGDHTVLLAGPGERLELTHRAHSREVFARGALAAALWVRGRPHDLGGGTSSPHGSVGRRPGLYDMSDVLGLRSAR